MFDLKKHLKLLFDFKKIYIVLGDPIMGEGKKNEIKIGRNKMVVVFDSGITRNQSDRLLKDFFSEYDIHRSYCDTFNRLIYS